MKRGLQYLLCLLIFAGLGFSREFMFVHINNRLYALYYHHLSDHPLPQSLSLLGSLDYGALYYFKYALTLLYFLGYFAASYYGVRYLCENKKYARQVLYIYALLLILSAIIMAAGYLWTGSLNSDEYTLSRWLMGIAQSPLVAFFSIASSQLYTNLTRTNNEKRHQDF